MPRRSARTAGVWSTLAGFVLEATRGHGVFTWPSEIVHRS